MFRNLYKLPKFLIASLFILIAIIFILVQDPPHQLCDTQLQHFKNLQSGLLYKNKQGFYTDSSRLNRKKKLCEKEQKPGTCYEYFYSLKQILKDLWLLSEECAAQVYKTPKVQKTLSQALSLMSFLAWDERVFEGSVSKYKWLNLTDLVLFCDIKRRYQLYYGELAYFQLEQQILKDLTSKKQWSLKKRKTKSLLSVTCSIHR